MDSNLLNNSTSLENNSLNKFGYTLDNSSIIDNISISLYIDNHSDSYHIGRYSFIAHLQSFKNPIDLLTTSDSNINSEPPMFYLISHLHSNFILVQKCPCSLLP